MPNTILKRWNGTAFEELYPKTTVGQIAASGTANSTTFLRGDGQWATPVDTGVTGTGTANLLTYWTGTNTIGSLSTGTYPSLTELSYVKGLSSSAQTQLTNRIPFGEVIMPTNPFGGKQLYINSIDNALHSADKKWYVTATIHSKTYLSETYPKLNPDYYAIYTTTTSNNTTFTITQTPKPSNVVVFSTITGGGTMMTQTATPTTNTQYSYNSGTGVITFGAARPDSTIYVYPGPEVKQYLDSPVESTPSATVLFNGDYESGISVAAGKYLKVKLTPGNNDYTTFQSVSITYPYGTFYGSYYYDAAVDNAYLRTYNYSYAGQTIGWKFQTFGNFVNTNTNVSYINSVSNGSDFGRTVMEFIFVAKDAKAASVTEIDWKLDRPSLSNSGSTVTKYGTNKLYDILNLGTQTANNIILNPNGALQANGLLTGGTIRTSVDGSAPAPGIGFTQDTNTGIFRPAEDVLAFAEGGTEAMRITSTGTLGIGVTTTNAQLDVKDTIHITNSQNTQHGLMLENRGTYFDNTGKPGIWSSSGIGGGSFSGEGGHLIIEGRKNSARNIYVKVGDTTTPTHIFKADGNVGIGTTSPLAKLVVSTNNENFEFGTASVTYNGGIIEYINRTSGSTRPDMNFFNSQGAIKFFTGGANERLRIANNGNVGIGTSSPAKQLEVQTANGTESAFRLRQLSQNYWDIRIPAGTTNLIINDVSAERLRIDSTGGQVGINESAPTAQLQVKSGATTRVPLIVDTLASHTATLQEWKSNNSTRAYMDEDGGFRTPGIRQLSASNNARINVNSTGIVIQRNINDTNPALIVDLANASATGNIQVWQHAGTPKVSIDKDGGISAVNLTLSGDLTVNGTTTNINTTNLVVEDKNIILGDVTTPSDTTADGGGITLKGASDKTITWVDSTDHWTSNQVFSAPNFVSTVATGTAPYSATSTTVNTNLNADLLDGEHGSYYAPLASPALTGTPTAPTAAGGTNTTQIATTQFVTSAVTGNINLGSNSITATRLKITADGTQPNWEIFESSNKLSVQAIDGSTNPIYDIWHSGNDGASSGLDADLLDGQQGTYYQAASTALTTSTSFGGDVSGTYNAIVVADDSHDHIISNVDGLQTALDSKAADADVVKLTGTQSVGGVKTFTSIPVFDAGITIANSSSTISDSITFNTAQTYTGPYLRGSAQVLQRGYYTAQYQIWDAESVPNPTSGTGTANQIAYYTGAQTLGSLSTATYPSLTELSYVKGVTSAIQTQLNREITKYRSTQQSSTSGNTNTTAVTSVTLLANKYYHLDVTGMYSKTSTSGSTAPVITIAVDNTTGTPTINGRFEWLNGSAATAYTVSNTNGAITTSTTARGFTAATATLSAITTTPWGLKALFYTGTSNKVLTFYIAHSSSVSGTVAVDNISIHATEVLA